MAVQARTSDKVTTLVSEYGDLIPESGMDIERLSYAHIAGSGVTLAYQVDDKSYVCYSSHSKNIFTKIQLVERASRSNTTLSPSRANG